MLHWYKYSLSFGNPRTMLLQLDSTMEDHAAEMGGYVLDAQAYSDKSRFFNTYLYNYHHGRLELYQKFIDGRIAKKNKILSLASGRCAIELALIKEGYSVTCSDLEKLPIHDRTKDLFSGFEFIELDFFKNIPAQKFDTVICLGTAYLFNHEKLDFFFQQAARSIGVGGTVILDAASAPDTAITILWSNYLKWELRMIQSIAAFRKREPMTLNIKHHGYHQNHKEICLAAGRAGFKLVEAKSYPTLIDFKRSILISRLLNTSSLFRKILLWASKWNSYIRMYEFKLVSD